MSDADKTHKAASPGRGTAEVVKHQRRKQEAEADISIQSVTQPRKQNPAEALIVW